MKIEVYNFYVRIPYYILNWIYNFTFYIYQLCLQRDFIREVELNEIPNDYNFYDKFFIFGDISKKRFYLDCDQDKYKLIYDDKVYSDENVMVDKKIMKMVIDEKINLYNLKDKEVLEIKFGEEIILSLIFKGYTDEKFYKFNEGYIQTKKLILERGIISNGENLEEIKEVNLHYFKIQGKIKDESNLINLVN